MTDDEFFEMVKKQDPEARRDENGNIITTLMPPNMVMYLNPANMEVFDSDVDL